jgi:hypothetical protein
VKSRRECQREAGELLKQMEMQKPGEYQRGHDVHVAPSLKDLGIHHKQSQRWQQIAAELGVHRNTVAADLCTKNSVRTEKVVHKQPRTKQSIMQKFCAHRKNA